MVSPDGNNAHPDLEGLCSAFRFRRTNSVATVDVRIDGTSPRWGMHGHGEGERGMETQGGQAGEAVCEPVRPPIAAVRPRVAETRAPTQRSHFRFTKRVPAARDGSAGAPVRSGTQQTEASSLRIRMGGRVRRVRTSSVCIAPAPSMCMRMASRVRE